MCESSGKLREIILNTKEPLILRNFKPNWSQFQNGLDDWCNKLDEYRTEPLHFECMSKSKTNTPQWERKRTLKQMAAKEFLQNLSKEEWNDYWFGLNYKRVSELPIECTNGIDFSCFGFPNAHKDCTFWLSSIGANTPCHYDTYGCNIVVQIYGRKLWILFPPETKLTPTRIPYEESSIYCLENFYAPNATDVEKLRQLNANAYIAELEANDILIVPHHWWHYVETMETSLSVNTWIPLDIDVENQIDECIVQYLMERFTKTMLSPLVEYVVNPNQIDRLDENNRIFDVLYFLLQQQQQQKQHRNTKDIGSSADNNISGEPSYYLNKIQLQKLLNDCEITINSIPNSQEKFCSIVKRNSLRYQLEKNEEDHISPLNPLEENLIASICHPQIIQNIKQEFVNKMKIKHIGADF